MTAASSSALFNATRYRRGSAGVGIGAAGGAVSGSVRSVRSAGGSRSRQRAWRVVAGARPRSGLSSSTPLPVAQRSYERVSARDRDAVLNALDQLGQRITIGDVAKRSGLDVATVEDVMRDVAADVDGFSLEVSEAGDIVYVKPGGIVNVRTALLGKSALLRVEPVLQKSGAVMSYLARVSFGSALVVSVVLVYMAIFVLLSSQQRSDSENRRGSYSYGRGPMPMRLYVNPFDFFFYWDPFYYRNSRMRIRERGKYNFLESVFSFVFGDGNPNDEYDNKRWEAIGRLVSEYDGVVTAEQLAPYIDAAPLLLDDGGAGLRNDEGFVLPVLQRFGGVAEVDEKGNIYYVFPDLQKTTTVSTRRKAKSVLPGFKLENKWAFSEAEPGQLIAAALLGAANLFGVFYLSNLLQPAAMRSLVYEFGGVVQLAAELLPFLKFYAASFFAIPFLRWLWIRRKNATIDARNEVKLQNADALSYPSPRTQQKLLDATRLSNVDLISRERIVFSSDDSVAETDLADFDSKLNDS